MVERHKVGEKKMAKESISGELSSRLRKIQPHLRTILEGVLRSARQAKNPLKYANAANGLRELLREMLETLAPDDEVKDCYWFVPDRSSETGITRRQRILYSIHGYVGNALLPKTFITEAESLAKRIVRQTKSLQKLTHISQQSLNIPSDESARLLTSVLRSYLILLNVIDKGKEVSRNQLAEILSAKLDDIFSEEIFDNLHILSTHTVAEYAEDVTIQEIDTTDKDTLFFSGRGSVLCELQYGSDGDLRRGEGLKYESNFPFTFNGEASTDLKHVHVDLDSIEVDTSSFYE